MWLQDVTYDELYLLHLELHHSLAAAKIKNLPNKYRQNEGKAILQYFIPETRWDEGLFNQIVERELGDRFIKTVFAIK